MASRRWSRGVPARSLTLAIALGLVIAGAASAAPSFDGQGRVIAVDPARRAVTIEHGGVPGIGLSAGQSEFTAQSAAMIGDARAGDRVRFTLGAADESHGLLTIVSLAPDIGHGLGWLDRGLVGATAILSLLALVTAVTVGVVLTRDLRRLHRRLVALDHEAGSLRGLVTETQDGVRLIARALEEATTTLRVGYVESLRHRLAAGPASRDGARDRRTGESGHAFVIVQRGRGDLYRAVEGGMAGAGVTVMWDRRRSERRRDPRRPIDHERRHSDRRGAPAETWTRLGFQLVPTDATNGVGASRDLQPVSGEPSVSR